MRDRKEDAVADIMGSVLLVGITVAMTVGLSLMVANIPGPPDEMYAELKISAQPGPDGNWGTGDEVLQIRHLYGESLSESHAKVVYSVNGASTTIEKDALGFSDDSFDIGERWQHTLVLQHNDDLVVNVVVPHGSGNRLMTATNIITGEANCSQDNDPPHPIVSQTPANVEALTGTNGALISALIVDICSAVDPTVIPNLWYEVGTTTQTIQMTNVGTDRYEAIIPAPNGNWLTVVGQTLDYRVENMRDTLGNLGNGPIVSDYIDPIPPNFHYVDGTTPIVGSIQDFANMQDPGDGGASATLAEGLGGSGSATTRLYANGLVSQQNWEKPERAHGGGFETDDSNAKYKFANDDPIRLTVMDPGPSTDAIQKVVLKGEGYQTLWQDDGWQLQACTSIGCTVISGIQDGWGIESTNAVPIPEAVFSFDVSNLRPGGGSWTWTDIQNIEVIVTPRIVFSPPPGPGVAPDGDWLLDAAWVEVTHGPGYDMDIQLDWNGVTNAATHTLELNYRVALGEFQVEVWDGVAWNPRVADPLTATSFTKWSTGLSAAEYNSGDPLIRIASKNTQPSQQGTVTIDYARIAY